MEGTPFYEFKRKLFSLFVRIQCGAFIFTKLILAVLFYLLSYVYCPSWGLGRQQGPSTKLGIGPVTPWAGVMKTITSSDRRMKNRDLSLYILYG